MFALCEDLTVSATIANTLHFEIPKSANVREFLHAKRLR
jgi:hypothetical protein